MRGDQQSAHTDTVMPHSKTPCVNIPENSLHAYSLQTAAYWRQPCAQACKVAATCSSRPPFYLHTHLPAALVLPWPPLTISDDPEAHDRHDAADHVGDGCVISEHVGHPVAQQPQQRVEAADHHKHNGQSDDERLACQLGIAWGLAQQGKPRRAACREQGRVKHKRSSKAMQQQGRARCWLQMRSQRQAGREHP